jgi:hypothetical protein
MKLEKFFILVVKKDTDSLERETDHRPICGRSKAYSSYEEAATKAEQYISEGRGNAYYIMEAMSAVRIKPFNVEIVRIK